MSGDSSGQGTTAPPASASAEPADSGTAPATETGPVALPQDGGLEGGAYVIDLDKPGYDRYPTVRLTVPNDGWESFGFGVGRSNVGVGRWDVDRVFSSQCTDKTKVHAGPSIQALVNALEDQQRQVVKKPVSIVQDGAHGVQLELRVPNNVDVSACDDGYFDSWTGAKDSTNAGCCRWQQGPGQVDRLWILMSAARGSWSMPTTCHPPTPPTAGSSSTSSTRSGSSCGPLDAPGRTANPVTTRRAEGFMVRDA